MLDRDGASALTYEVAEGYAPLRAAIRDYVSALGIRTRADNILITGGAQQALDLAIQALVAEGETIVTSNPTYLGIIDIARARRIQVHGIPTDEYGIRLDYLGTLFDGKSAASHLRHAYIPEPDRALDAPSSSPPTD